MEGLAEVAYRGDAVDEPQFQDVVGRYLLQVVERQCVDVGVDEAGHDVVARHVDLVVAFLGPPARLDPARCAD